MLNSDSAQDLTPQDLVKSHLQHTALARAYVLDDRVLRNTVLITARFFVPLWFIAVVFVLPCALLYDVVLWITGGFGPASNLTSVPASVIIYLGLAKALIWISTYFASFVIVGEVSDICLGGTASFYKAMYKTSVRGVGRLLGTDILYIFVLSLALAITYLFSEFVIGPLVGEDSAASNAVSWVLYILSWSLPTWLFLFTAQVVAIERRYWFSALTRSASLVWQSKKQSLAMFALFAFTVLVWQLCSFLLGVLAGAARLSLNELNVIASVVLWAPYVPIPNILLTLAYYKLRRIRGELSAELLADIKAYEMS